MFIIWTVEVDNTVSSSDNYLYSAVGSDVHIMAIAADITDISLISSSDGILVPAAGSDGQNGVFATGSSCQYDYKGCFFTCLP